MWHRVAQTFLSNFAYWEAASSSNQNMVAENFTLLVVNHIDNREFIKNPPNSFVVNNPINLSRRIVSISILGSSSQLILQ